MKNLNVKSGHLVSKVIVPSSKSYANRALIIAALLNEAPGLKNLPVATDVTILLNSLKQVGLSFELKGNDLFCQNSFPACETGDQEIEVGEGGTTARFLATMLLLGKYKYRLILGKRLKDRPWAEFLNLAKSLGAKADLSGNVLTIQGPVQLPSELKIDCSKTTQFASAFQLLTTVKNVEVLPDKMNSSKSYWLMNGKIIEEMQKRSLYEIPLDWSSASYPMAFAALNHSILFPGLKPDEFQADSKFYKILSMFNCIDESEEGLLVQPVKENMSITYNVSDCLDLVPTLAFFLSHIEGSHILQGVENLIHKESDRLQEILLLLKKFQRKAFTQGNDLHIEGSNLRINERRNLQMPDDHRMVMVGTLFLLHHGGGEIGPAEAVKKSYPDFFQLISPEFLR